MIKVEDIKEIIYNEGKPMSFESIISRLGDAFVSKAQLKRMISNFPEQFQINKEGKADLAGDSMYKYKMELFPVDIESRNELVDIYLAKLLDVFKLNNVREPIQHFASLVLFDRLMNYHFSVKGLAELPRRYNPSVLYTSPNQVQEYLKILKDLDKNEFFQKAFSGIINLLENENQKTLQQTYYSAFNVCMEFYSHQHEPILFGKKFNRFLSSSLITRNSDGLFTTPEFISRFVANISTLRSGDLVFNPAAGIGSLFVELAHHFKIYDFRAVGMDINWGTVVLCKINLLLNGIVNFTIHDGDSLSEDVIPDESADISISNPPFGSSRVPAEMKYQISHRYGFHAGNDFASLFMGLMLKKTKPHGKIITVVSDAILFGKQNNILRQYLVDNNYVEKVFSLPAGLYFPLTSIGSNVLLLSKEPHRKNVVSFFNGRDAIKIQIKNKRPSFSEHEIRQFINGISTKITEIGKNPDAVFIPNAHVMNQVVVENEYDLTPARYTHQVLSEIARAKQGGDRFVRLHEILLIPDTKSNKSEFSEWPYLKVKDLKKDKGFLYFSEIRGLDTPTIKEIISGRIIDQRALLVARVGSDLKPTILAINEEEKVVVNNNIHFFVVDTSRVNEEYLLGQLSSGIVREQADLFRTKVAAESLSKDKFLQIEIPLPPLSQQLEWVAKNVRKGAEKDELATFIKSIPLIENSQDIKKEIERFAKAQFQSESAEYKRYFEDRFPFSKAEIESFVRAKKTKNNSITLIALQNDEYGMFGSVAVADENPIDFRKVQTVNEYAAFLIKIYDFLTKSSINRQLDSFAHTSRNFFYKLQGEITALVNSKNESFQKIMDSAFVETDHAIEYFEKKGSKEKKDFLLRNQLLSIIDQVSSQYKFYNQIHEMYSEIKNSQLGNFYFQVVIDDISEQFNSHLKYKTIPKTLILGKKALLEHAMLDLVNNAINYSSNGSCELETFDKGNSFVLTLSNPVDTILSEEKYNMLGQTWIKDNSNGVDRVCSGVYYAFQMIRESLGEATLVDYGNYKHNKIFKVLIQLRKHE